MLHSKSHTIYVFLCFKTMVEVQFNIKLKAIQIDERFEFKRLTSLLVKDDILHRITYLYTSKQNGVV